jgi:IS1 family transposase
MRGMNKLPLAKRAQILTLLCEGMSMRSIERTVGCSINTIDKLLQDAGDAAAAYHDKHVRGVKATKVQCDEVWSFCCAKQKNVADAKRKDMAYGDVWTWTAIDGPTKLLISYLVGGRDGEYAMWLMDDLRSRLANRVQLTTDGHKAYLNAVEEAFGAEVDYAMLVKLYGGETGGQGHERKYSPSECLGTRTASARRSRTTRTWSPSMPFGTTSCGSTRRCGCRPRWPQGSKRACGR